MLSVLKLGGLKVRITTFFGIQMSRLKKLPQVTPAKLLRSRAKERKWEDLSELMLLIFLEIKTSNEIRSRIYRYELTIIDLSKGYVRA